MQIRLSSSARKDTSWIGTTVMCAIVFGLTINGRAQDEGCRRSDDAACFVEYKVAKAHLSKCGFPEYVTTSVPPRLKIYRMQKTRVEASFYSYGSGTDGETGPNCYKNAGPWWMETDNTWDNTLEEECFRV